MTGGAEKLTGEAENGTTSARKEARTFLGFMLALLLFPMLLGLILSFAPLPDAALVEHGKSLSQALPALDASYRRLLVFRSVPDAAWAVVDAFWGFAGETVVALSFGIWVVAQVVVSKPRGGTRPAERPAPHGQAFTVAKIVASAIIALVVFCFVPLAYVPAPGTSFNKAFHGAIGATFLLDWVWGYTLAWSVAGLGTMLVRKLRVV